ncbi:MAG: cobalamin-binding protein [Thiomonas sp.]|uniref:cobalamin-binding protein n=1 Tax=Thiomonas sp. TaxID=2047785 RepID=UPI002A35CE53|nr:cobalamin-binding protein [Thiomonas sp.]MDY0330314.1 cobalamin-binding protein [Thiomonas sp.]
MSRFRWLCAVFTVAFWTVLWTAPVVWAAPVRVTDDAGHEVSLPAPAKRIIALSPQLLELSAAAGASKQIVARIQGTDDVPWARSLPIVGDAFALNLEAIVRLKPDLILAWQSGTPPREAARLKALGIPIYWSQANTFESLASTVSRIGELAGTQKQARRWVRDFNARLAAIEQRYAAQKPAVRVFYEVWNQPLITVGGKQLISQAITLCGGRNVFGALSVLAPTIGLEAVLQADPQLIVTASPQAAQWLRAWKRFPQLSAVRHDQLVALSPNALPRMGVDVLDGVQQLCNAVSTARRAVQR